ncbi:hypothetical protein [Pseudomonas sp. dw_358]|uniref:hypothetical protein n=1 Tax=Pseudomonas sp. dw_358 TaxID=2720083 RepID=UPI001BD5079F|nr:hypothetical protein [Pseudomonas sp. dw_358]
MSPAIRTAVLAVSAWLSTTCLAQEQPSVYQGTLGPAKVVMELDMTDPAQVSGRYFYEKYHRDLALVGALEGEQLELNEGLENFDEAPRPVLSLHADGAQGWTGQWRDPKGKTLAISLKPAQLTPEAADTEPFWHDLRSSSPYEYLRLSALDLVDGKAEERQGYRLQWQEEPGSKITLFQLLDGYPRAQLTTLNRELHGRLWSEVSAFHACMLGASRMGEGEFEQTVTPQLFTPDILSVNIFTSYNCGGAHPDFGDAPLNIDVRSGQPLSLEDVLWVGEGKAMHYDDRDGATPSDRSDVDFDTFTQYREKTLAPWLVEQFKHLYPQQMTKTTDDDCDYSDPQVWRFPAWYFTPKGLYLGPGFARVMRACEGTDWTVLPYSLLRQHPGGVALPLPQG